MRCGGPMGVALANGGSMATVTARIARSRGRCAAGHGFGCVVRLEGVEDRFVGFAQQVALPGPKRHLPQHEGGRPPSSQNRMVPPMGPGSPNCVSPGGMPTNVDGGAAAR